VELFISNKHRGRKSTSRVDAGVTDGPKKSKHEQLAEALGVENFLGDLTTKTVVHKSEESKPSENLNTNLDMPNRLAKSVHELWREVASGVHPQQVPYEELTESQKEYDLAIAKSALHFLSESGLAMTVTDIAKSLVYKKLEMDSDLSKADNSHLPDGAERCTYTPSSNYNVVYIPVNRLRQVYQSDEALNPTKVNENRRKMKAGIPLDPVEIGYNYDVHDGHHRWAAARKEGYTHVPCKVVGTDPQKVKAAIKGYMEVWKAMELDIIIDL
jgi:hypothetical protein